MKYLNYLFLLKPNWAVFTHSSFWFGVIFAVNKGIEVPVASVFFSIMAFLFFYGSIYIMNDLFDLESDRKDPVLSKRLIASGKIPIKHAQVEMFVTLVIALAVAALIDTTYFVILLVFLFLNSVYSGILKKFAYIDILFMSLSHPLKFFTGIFIAGVSLPISSLWPVLIFIYCVALAIHAEKQLARILRNGKRHFLFGAYTVRGLLVLGGFLPTVLIFMFSSLEQWLLVIWLFTAVVVTSGILLLVFNGKYRNWRGEWHK